MNRRATTLGVALALLVAMLVAGRFIHVPYVILQPGPVTDTLGNVPAGDTTDHQPGGPVISISGATTHPTTGHLDLTTVEELPGDCSAHPSLYDTVKAWFDKTQTVEPQAVQCPPNQSSQQVQAQDEQEMTQSQSDAVTAALFQLGYHPTSQFVTVGTDGPNPGAPAAAVLEAGDEILAVNGKGVTTVPELQAAEGKVAPGVAVMVTYRRNGKTKTASIKTIKGSNGKAILGIPADRIAMFGDVTVKIGIDPNVIGGPSAGTALALGIIDKLTPDGLTGGRTIAGTGTVDGFGNVGPIGGIQQKIAGATRAGATVFFAPASECHDARGAAPKSLTLVKVTTLAGAVKALQAIKAGSTDFPHC